MNLHLIIGASGLVGEHLVAAVTKAGSEAVGTYYSHPVGFGNKKLDIRCPAELNLLLQTLCPDVVYLPASLTNVDYCELNPLEGYAINVVGVSNVVQAVNEIGAKLVYFSSNYIFDGKAGPYNESHPGNPICEYGRQKLSAEHYVALYANNYLIIRTTVVYGWERQGKNFIYRLLDSLKAGKKLRVPLDQIGNPTFAPNLAQAVVELVCLDASGVYNIVGSERVSRYDFACEAADIFGLDRNLIDAVLTSELEQIAPRPLNAGMTIDKAIACLGTPLLGYRDGLRVMSNERV